MPKQRPVYDDFCLRSVLSHSETISDEKCYLYCSTRLLAVSYDSQEGKQVQYSFLWKLYVWPLTPGVQVEW